MKFGKTLVAGLIGLTSILNGCGEEEPSALKRTIIDESPVYVYVKQPFEDLYISEQIRGYAWVRKEIIKEIQKIHELDIPTEGIFDGTGTLDMAEQIDYMRGELEKWEEKIVGSGQGLNWKTYIPSAAIPVFVGWPFSASLGKGLSGVINVYFVVKAYKVTKIDKSTEEPVSEYYDVDAAIKFAARVGGGIGAGASAGIHWGAGFIWGDIDRPSEFDGTSLQGIYIPFAKGVGPFVIAGGIYDGIGRGEIGNFTKKPRLIYGILGHETGVGAKANETHVQIGPVSDIWNVTKLIPGIQRLSNVASSDAFLEAQPLEPGTDTPQTGGTPLPENLPLGETEIVEQ